MPIPTLPKLSPSPHPHCKSTKSVPIPTIFPQNAIPSPSYPVKSYPIPCCKSFNVQHFWLYSIKGKGKVNHAPQESIGGCSSLSPRPWARRWRTTNVCDAWPVPDLQLSSQPQGITAHWLVPNYTAWWQKHMCVNNLPRIALDSGVAGIHTCDLLIASLASYHDATDPHRMRECFKTVRQIYAHQMTRQCTTHCPTVTYRSDCRCRYWCSGLP